MLLNPASIPETFLGLRGSPVLVAALPIRQAVQPLARALARSLIDRPVCSPKRSAACQRLSNRSRKLACVGGLLF